MRWCQTGSVTASVDESIVGLNVNPSGSPSPLEREYPGLSRLWLVPSLGSLKFLWSLFEDPSGQRPKTNRFVSFFEQELSSTEPVQIEVPWLAELFAPRPGL
jgi:hypothetical protein